MGPWTDLYAVGLLFYQALCGRRPFDSEDRKELLLLRQSPPPLPTRPDGGPLPASLEEVLDNLLDPEPRQRYDRASDVRRLVRQAFLELETGVRLRPIGRRTAITDPNVIGPMLPSGEAPFAGGVPTGVPKSGALRWNKVMPDPMPPEPPEAHGRGATARASLSLFGLREIPLVGRKAHRQAIWDVARRVVTQSQPGVVVIVGKSGTGKTRLVESIALPLDETGFMEVVRLLYHWPPGIDDGYRNAVREILAPWQDDRKSLEARLARWLSRDRQMPPESVTVEASVLARWCGHLEHDEVAVNSAVGLAYLYRHLDARSWRGGSCLVLDDVHRSAEEGDGLAIAQALLDRTVGLRPVLVLATVAAEALATDEKLQERLEHLRAGGALILDLPPLTLDETRQLLTEALFLDPELTDAVAHICEGNPLAVSLLLREWTNRDLLVLGKNSLFSLRPGVPIEDAVPPSIRQLYIGRLEAAVKASIDPVAAGEALAAAALVDQAPPAMVIREISETGLDGLLATGVLREAGNVLTFEHGSVQRTARTLARRLPDISDIHNRLARAWATIGERSSINHNYPIGYHLLRGKDYQNSVAPMLRAVRTLIEEGRYAMASRASALALEAADRCGTPMLRQEARRLSAEAHIELRHYEDAQQLIREALTFEPIDRLSWARLHLLLSRTAMGVGDLDSCRRYLDQAGTAFETVLDKDGSRDVAHGRATLERLEGSPQKAIDYFQQALGLVKRDPRREVLILSGLIESMLTAGHTFGVDRYRNRMMQVAQESGDTRNIAKAAYTSGTVYLNRNRLDLAERYLQTASALSATLGDHWLHLNCQNNLGEVARFRGDLDEARRHYHQYTRIADEQNLTNAVAVGRINLALLALQESDDDELAQQISFAENALTNQPRHWTWVFIGVIRAGILARQGDEPKTRAWWSVAREHGLTSLRTPDLWLPLQRLQQSAFAAGWFDIARSAALSAQDLAPLAGRVENVVVDEEYEQSRGEE